MFAFFLIVLLQTCACSQQQLSGKASVDNVTLPVQTFDKDGLWGLKDSKENTVVEPAYKKLIRLGDNAWIVQKRNKFGVIDNYGNILVPIKYRHVDRYFEKFAKLGNDHDYGLYDEYGNTIVPAEYTKIDPLFGQMFLTYKNYKYGLMDFNGNILLNNDFDDIYMPDKNTMRIRYDGQWFQIERWETQDEIKLPENASKMTLDDKDYKITTIISDTGIMSGYGVLTATDYTIKLFSSISPAYEETIDELMLSQGAETVNIFIKLGWLPKFPFTYAKKYWQNLRTPTNGPLYEVRSDMKKQLSQ